MNASRYERDFLTLWWLNPAILFCVCGLLIGIAAYLIDEPFYRSFWRTPKFFDTNALLVTLACIAVFAFGAVVSVTQMARVVPRVTPADNGNLTERIPRSLLLTLFRITFWLTVLGYALWIGLAIQRGITPEVVLRVAAGEKGAMYEARFNYLPTVAGVTTLAEFGTATAILGALFGSIHGWAAVRWKLGILFLLALVRAVLNSERLALIELVVPFVIACLPFWLSRSSTRSWWDRSKKTRIAWKLAPVIGAGSLWVLFTTFEYVRSWKNYYSGGELGLWAFGAVRLLGYYVTSFNNGAFLLARLDPLNAPYFMLHFLWLFPLSNPVVHRLFQNPLLDTNERWFYFPFLQGGANVEFNNADGILSPLMDYGIASGLIYWFFAGMACGLLYELYRRKEPAGLLMYPAIYLGLMEAPLVLYWAEGRCVPSLSILLLAPVLFRFWSAAHRRPLRPAVVRMRVSTVSRPTA
jgi:hypothetical protein